ncbi:MAG: hypothetical protein LCH86_09365 [Proteobacteria bacterium]|uniref:hypothetical protein n=1 Tax=Novosphingobium sp. HII-3 TaxID=2075565 RepID=UPI000CDA6DF0|nr:hypothetical protein [Novosphingobium sp. HII-3]MCA0276201.1 hypothetical protein [Pseudomonadota bacterium]
MGGRGLVATDTGIDRELAQVFFANGEGFLPSAALADRGDARETCYAIAIASELVLKAFLVAQGWSDDRCRREIRHDLEKGLACALAAGLEKTPSELGYVIGVLNAYYPNHAFDRFVASAGDEAFPVRARSVIAGLFGRVRPHVEVSGGS